MRWNTGIMSLLAALALAPVLAAAPGGTIPCPEAAPLRHWTSGPSSAFTDFYSGEEFGSRFEVPAEEYPIEILRVKIGWGSHAGGQPPFVGQAIKLYPSANPGASSPIFTFGAPTMIDGGPNEFDFEAVPGNKIIQSGTFMIVFRFGAGLNGTGIGPLADTDGCTGHNSRLHWNMQGWDNSCNWGATGDWQIDVVYRSLTCESPPSLSLCFGDGSEIACPCNNEAAIGSGTGCLNSSGLGALLEASGSNSVVNDDLVLHVSQARANEPGVFMQGNPRAPFLLRDGLACLGNPTERLEFVFTDSNGNKVSSVSIVNRGNISPGAIRNYQFYFRDPQISPCGTGRNLSNAVQVRWQ